MEDGLTTHNPTITGAGFDSVLQGAEMMGVLGVTPEDLRFPANVDKLRDIAAFMNQYEDAGTRIRSAMYKKPLEMGSIDHAYRYVTLQNKRMGLRQELGAIEGELAFFE